MPWPESFEAHLPPTIDGEPDDLRRDILDELEDHLDCAMRRELHRNPDESVARRAVLDRFGDPRAVARRLLFDAMKEQIMSQRISLVTNVVLATACIALCIIMWCALQESRAVNEAILARLDEQEEAIPLDWSRAAVTVVDGQSDPVPGLNVVLKGDLYGDGDRNTIVYMKTDEAGHVALGAARPGQDHRLEVKASDGLRHTRRMPTRPGAESHATIEWPSHATSTVEIAADLGLPEGVLVTVLLTPYMTNGDATATWRVLEDPISLVIGANGVAVMNDIEPGIALAEGGYDFAASVPVTYQMIGVDVDDGWRQMVSVHLEELYANETSAEIGFSFSVTTTSAGPWRLQMEASEQSVLDRRIDRAVGKTAAVSGERKVLAFMLGQPM